MFARTALLISGLFLIAGLAAVFATAGLILAIVMSVAATATAAAAIAFARKQGAPGLSSRLWNRMKAGVTAVRRPGCAQAPARVVPQLALAGR